MNDEYMRGHDAGMQLGLKFAQEKHAKELQEAHEMAFANGYLNAMMNAFHYAERYVEWGEGDPIVMRDRLNQMKDEAKERVEEVTAWLTR